MSGEYDVPNEEHDVPNGEHDVLSAGHNVGNGGHDAQRNAARAVWTISRTPTGRARSSSSKVP